MIMTVLTIMVAAMLAAVILTQGTSADRHSGRGANWNQALQSADAGVEQAVAKLQASNGAVPPPFSGSSSDGTYNVTVTYLGHQRYQIDSNGTGGDGCRPGDEAARPRRHGPTEVLQVRALSRSRASTRRTTTS